MTDQPSNSPDELRNTAAQDQKLSATRDAAIHTIRYYEMLKASNIPEHLVERLTVEFQQMYLATLWGLKLTRKDGRE